MCNYSHRQLLQVLMSEQGESIPSRQITIFCEQLLIFEMDWERIFLNIVDYIHSPIILETGNREYPW